MEAIERVGKQHDSFEEVDRILTIVEINYKEYSSFNRLGFLIIVLITVVMIITISYALIGGKIFHVIPGKNILETNALMVFGMLLLPITTTSWSLLYYQRMLAKQKVYRRVRDQAIEVLRETIPVVARLERWSALKKFEIRLRLSKLDISPEEILK